MSGQNTPQETDGGGACPHCGGSAVLRGLALNQNAEVGHIGLPYKALKFLVGTEPLLADLCESCGTVVRLYVRETKRSWIVR